MQHDEKIQIQLFSLIFLIFSAPPAKLCCPSTCGQCYKYEYKYNTNTNTINLCQFSVCPAKLCCSSTCGQDARSSAAENRKEFSLSNNLGKYKYKYIYKYRYNQSLYIYAFTYINTNIIMGTITSFFKFLLEMKEVICIFLTTWTIMNTNTNTNVHTTTAKQLL